MSTVNRGADGSPDAARPPAFDAWARDLFAALEGRVWIYRGDEVESHALLSEALATAYTRGLEAGMKTQTAGELQNAEMPTDPRTRGRMGNAPTKPAVPAAQESDTKTRLEQIKESLRVEWRLKAESGIHHDHLSDLAFLIVELEFTQSKLAAAVPAAQDARPDIAQILTDASELRSSYGFILMRCAVASSVDDVYDVLKREFTEHEAAFARLERALPSYGSAEWHRLTSDELPPVSAPMLVTCERCQIKVPERLATFGIGVRAGKAAWCAACRVPDGPDGQAKRAEVVALRKARQAAHPARQEPTDGE